MITTIQKVETSFNFVWRVQRARNFARRFAEYLSVMIAGPILLAVALGLLGSALHSPTARWLDSIAPLAWALTGLAGVLPYVIVSAVFVFMYMFIPNIRVEVRAALIGGVTGGRRLGARRQDIHLDPRLLLDARGGLLGVRDRAVHAHLGVLELADFAARRDARLLRAVSAVPPAWAHAPLRSTRRRTRVSAFPSCIWSVATIRAARWIGMRRASPTGSTFPGRRSHRCSPRLEQATLLVATEKESFVPGRDPHAIKLSDIIEALRRPQHGRAMLVGRAIPQAQELVARIDATVHRDLGDRSLADFIGGV